MSWGLEAAELAIGGDVAREDHHRLLVFARDKTEDEDVALSSEVALQDHLVAEEGVAMEHHLFTSRPHQVVHRARRGEGVVARVAEPLARGHALHHAFRIVDAAVRTRVRRLRRGVLVVAGGVALV